MACLALDASGAVWPGAALHAQSVITRYGRIDRRTDSGRRAFQRRQRRTYAPTILSSDAFRPILLKGVAIGGSSQPATLFAPAYAGFVGRVVTLADVNAIVDAVAARYAGTDTALYAVAAADPIVVDGVLRLQATESHVSAIALEPDEGVHVAHIVGRLARGIVGERPLRQSSLDRLLASIRRIPGVTVEASFSADAEPGAVTLHLKLHQRRVQISIGANDFGQRGLGTAQADATLGVNGLLREGDLTQVTVLGSPADRRLRYIAVNRSDPIGDATITLTGSYLRTNVVGVEGRAYSGAIQIAYPLLRTGTDLVSVSAALDGLNNSNAFIGETIASDRSRAVRASIVYLRQMPTVEWSLMASLSRGVDILGARTLTPQISDLTFTKATFDFDVSVALATRLTARVKAAGQYTTDRLPSVEQLALGGPTTGRAFRSVTAIGDRGLYGSVELARSVATKGSADTLEVYGYADAGRVRYLGRLGFVGVDQTLASAGVGARTAIAAGIAADFFVARALFQEPELQPHPWRLGAALRFTR